METTSNAPSPPPTPTLLSLSSEHFVKACERYIDETKPDQLLRRQMQEWTLEWENDGSYQNGIMGRGDSDDLKLTHMLCGRLCIQGEYTAVTLHTACWWGENKNAAYILQYQCSATAELLSEKESPNKQPQQQNEETSQDRRRRLKIHNQMVQRLSQDDYISKLVLAKKHDQPALVFQANIQLDKENLEERVQTEQDTAEAIRRAVCSHAESTLDVLDLLVSLPSLPTSSNTANLFENDHWSAVAKLADRAKLRLLEDFMCDACEQEGEDELVDDLNLRKEKEESTKRSKVSNS